MTTQSLSVWPPLPTKDETAYQYTKKIDAVTGARMLSGFEWRPPSTAIPATVLAAIRAVTGKDEVPTFKFSTKMTDQLNITQAAILASQAAAAGNLQWTQPWQGWLDGVQYTLSFNLMDFNVFTEVYAAAKNKHLVQGWEWKSKINAATTADEVLNVFKTFGLTEREIYDAERMPDSSM